MAIKGITNAPQYVIGDQPKFTMVVTNIGLVACKRDVGAAVLAAYVYSLDNQRLWSNLDCAPSNETLVKTFNPGEQVTTEVTWTGMGSAPNARCPASRSDRGPQPGGAAGQPALGGGAVHALRDTAPAAGRAGPRRCRADARSAGGCPRAGTGARRLTVKSGRSLIARGSWGGPVPVPPASRAQGPAR